VRAGDELMHCEHCNEEVNADLLVCPHCGKALHADARDADLDHLVERASVPNLGSMFEAARKSGLISASTQAYT